MKIRNRHRAAYLANPQTFMDGLRPVLDFNFGITPTSPTDPAARAIYEELLADLKHDLAVTAQIRGGKA